MNKTLWLSLMLCGVLSGMSPAVLVDDFNGYSIGTVDAVTANWKGIGSPALSVIRQDPLNAGNRVLGVTEGQNTGVYGILSGDAVIPNGATKTVFFRILTTVSSGTAPNTAFGLIDLNVPPPNCWADISTFVRIINGGIQARNGTADSWGPARPVAANMWYNVWIVTNHSAKTFELYVNEGSEGATGVDKVGGVYAFRSVHNNALDRFVTHSWGTSQILFDDIVVMNGVDLSNPPLSDIPDDPVFIIRTLIENGDFESGGSGTFGANPYPSAWAGSGQNGAHHSDASYRNGQKGVVFWSSDTQIYQDFAVVSGRAYTISAEAVTPSADPIQVWEGRIAVRWYNAARSIIGTEIVGSLTDSDAVDVWKTVADTLIAPAGATLGRVLLGLEGALIPDGQGGTLNAGRVYFDDVVVRGHHPDYTDDNKVDLHDFAIAASTWLDESPMTDLTGDSFFGPDDLSSFAEQWLEPIPEYELVWADEFDGPGIDLAYWSHQNISGQASGNNELQHYTSDTKNSRIENGALVIEAIEDGYWSSSEQRWYPYTSARLRTVNKFDLTYGRIEARIKLPSTTGIWPAFWMMPTDAEYGGWAASGEIDIMESINQANRVYGTIHYGGGWPNNVHSGGSYADGTDYSQDFHVYVLEWEPTRMRWYVDGILFTTQTSWYTSGHPYPAPFDKRFHLLLNVAVGGNWPGYPDQTSVFPQRMTIDYVRVYKRAR